MNPPLGGWTVVDLSSGIAGGYCTKLLADGGAEVVKVEAPGGDPLRSWSASGAGPGPGADGALFQFLAGAKRSVVFDPADDPGGLSDLLAGAQAVVWSPGSPVADLAALAPGALRRSHPHLTLTAITPFGLEGPWSGRPATELTLQAWSGGVIGLGRGDPARAPVQVGGQVGAWLAGAYAAAGTLMSEFGRRARGTGELVDVSVLEAVVLSLTYYPVTYFDALGRPFRGRRSVVTPGVGRAKDGLVAVGVGTGQQWLDFCVLVGHPEWQEDRSLFRERSHLAPVIDEWFARHTVDEVRDLANAFRLPNAPVANGEILPLLDQFATRGTFGPAPGGGFVQPGPPYRLDPVPLRPPAPAPALGQHTGAPLPPPPGDDAPGAVRPVGTALDTLRVLDMTAFWAGPSCSHVLAQLGAEVIHLESTRRPDGARTLGAPPSEEQWWERSPIFAALNTNKLDLTVDFRSEPGMEVLRRLVATCDVVIENFTPRVLEQAGLTFEALRAIRPDIVVVRMPGFGLDGPWRDNAAFAYTIEDASGLTWMTGYPGDAPWEPYGVGDPNAGIHALVGLLLALAHRARTGEGVLVEAAMVDAAVNVTAEQVIEWSAHGALLTRDGNRGPGAAPQNLYRTADVDHRGNRDGWVALAVATDEQWRALVEALGTPDWAGDPALACAEGRRAAQDRLDQELSAWCAQRAGEDIVGLLWPAGVPVGLVTAPHHQGELDQLQARGFFEVLEHPVLGPARYATLPMRFSSDPGPRHRRPAPALGEHNDALLAELGFSPEQIARLEADQVIGRVPGGTRA